MWTTNLCLGESIQVTFIVPSSIGAMGSELHLRKLPAWNGRMTAAARMSRWQRALGLLLQMKYLEGKKLLAVQFFAAVCWYFTRAAQESASINDSALVVVFGAPLIFHQHPLWTSFEGLSSPTWSKTWAKLRRCWWTLVRCQICCQRRFASLWKAFRQHQKACILEQKPWTPLAKAPANSRKSSNYGRSGNLFLM